MTELLKAASRGQWSCIKLLLRRHLRAAGSVRYLQQDRERRGVEEGKQDGEEEERWRREILSLFS